MSYAREGPNNIDFSCDDVLVQIDTSLVERYEANCYTSSPIASLD